MTEQMLYHGADYNPDQWLGHPDILARDLALMRQAHINVVTLGIFAWPTLEPTEGDYQLDWMAQVIDNLYQNGVQVALCTPSGARPAWLAQAYPEVRRVDANRVRQLFGMRQNHCYTSPIYRQKVRLLNQQLARRFGSHPGVILWHISNEFGGECHCPLCQAAFRGWLRQKYTTLDAVNAAWNSKFWGHDYTDWEQIESPAPHGENALHGLKLDWRRFVSHQTLDFYKWETAAIREIVPQAKFTTNMMYHFDGLDYFKFAKEMDIACWDSYPTWHKPGEPEAETALDTALMHDLMYSIKHKPFWLMESTPSTTNWQPISKVKKPGMQLLSSLQAVAHGADAVLYFQWRQSRGAFEKFHGAVVGHDGRADNRVFVETAAVGRALESLQAVSGSKKPQQAAIVLDWENKWAMEEAQGPRNAGLGYWQELQRHYNGLARAGITVDFVNEDSDLAGYKLVVAPMLYLLREDFAATLRAFVAQGGTLVVTYWSGVVNETDLCWLGDTPHHLTDLLGLRRTEIDALYDGETRRCTAVGAEMPPAATGSILCEVAALAGATPLMQYAEDFYKGSPAVTRHPFGAGKAYYLATRFEEGFYTTFYEKICAGLFPPAWPTPLPQGVHATRRAGYIFLQNFTTQPATVGALTIPPYGTQLLEAETHTSLCQCSFAPADAGVQGASGQVN
ncbi:MAG: beta-galactosidase [Gemmiger sp.]|nr:beta-galactosidase [Gemmiger sp.]